MADVLYITLPWSVLVPDNEKYTVAMMGKPKKPRIILTKQYREAKAHAHFLALGQTLRERVRGRIAICVELFEPNHRADRQRDLTNYSKLLHDALQGAAYANDSYLDGVLYLRGGVDPKHPRAEIIVATKEYFFEQVFGSKHLLPSSL